MVLLSSANLRKFILLILIGSAIFVESFVHASKSKRVAIHHETLKLGAEVTAATRNKFLEKKLLFSEDTRRIYEIDFLKNPSLLAKDEPEKAIYYQQCQDRLNNLLRRWGDKTSDSIPPDVQSFEQFCELCPEWGAASRDSTYVLHRDCPQILAKKDCTIQQRVQPLSGLCYLLGPDMMQHYLVAMGSTAQAVTPGMINISRLIRTKFTKEQLTRHIFDNGGGDSKLMLEYILQPHSAIIASELHEKNLRLYGPGLVSNFAVHDDFADKSIHRHHGRPLGKSRGRHCMVLIGCRVDASSGKTCYLLQNWWKAKQFVEVDEDYLKACTATVYFVQTLQTRIPTKFPTSFANYASFLDKPEGHSCVEYILQ